jgi:CHAT domain-containing protein
LTSKSNWGDLPYLANKKVLSYGFSLQTLARENHSLDGASYVGFAPSFKSNTSLAFLKNSNAGVEKGRQILGGNIFMERQATSGNFLQHAMQADVLHLFTHGVSSDSSYDASYIYLQDRKMYVDEIMNLPLRVNLCLLTACEVGLGKNYSGEGATGVAWAFKVAGANNVVQSLWKLNEKTSSELMGSFFENLKEGLSSDVALSKAKQDYLHNPEISTRLKHPYYWAGMSHYGSGTVIKEKSHTLLYSLTVGLVLFASLVFLYLKKVTSR